MQPSTTPSEPLGSAVPGHPARVGEDSVRRYGFRAAALAAAWVLLVVWVSPAGAQGVETIHAYDVEILIQQDGSLLLTERIDYDFGSSDHHGIFRDVPVRFVHSDRYDRVYPLEVVSVEGSPGTPDEYEVEEDGNLLRIKIGDPDRTISGRHTYTIVYRVEGALNGFRSHDELYWNAVGAFWAAPIERATATVTAPARITQIACFAGPQGSALPCGESTVRGRTASFAEQGLSPYEALTVVVAIPTGVVPPPRPVLEERWSLARAFSITPFTGGVAGALLIAILVGFGTLIWRRGRDRRAIGSPVDIAYGTTAGGEQAVPLFEPGAYPVEYGPPDEIRPGQVGTLIDEVANPLDVTATIVDLAVRGYVRIEEIPKQGILGKPDWRLEKVREPDDDLLGYERTLFDGLFEDAGEDGRVQLSDLKQQFSTRLRRVEQGLYTDAMRRKWFAGRPDRVRQAWSRRGWLLLLVGGGLAGLAAATSHLGLLPIPIAVGGLLLISAAHWMPRRTAKGTGLVRRVLGFRTYIDTAEAREMQFQERENLFSTYLPYAIVFGCTEKWARAFAGLDQEMPSTSWYVGPHPFTLGAFTHSIDSFTVTSAGTISSTPSSAGGSGFGSGGFSGGGGGGGGGGSW